MRGFESDPSRPSTTLRSTLVSYELGCIWSLRLLISSCKINSRCAVTAEVAGLGGNAYHRKAKWQDQPIRMVAGPRN